MVAISAKLVKELRDKTGAGMMDCKKALKKADGNIDSALDELRKSGIAKAEKKSGRSVNAGKILTAFKDDSAVMLEVLCETDFVASNDKFIDFVNEMAERILDIDSVGDLSSEVQKKEEKSLTEMIATIGENMQINRAIRWKSEGKFHSYLHMGGKVGVLVDVSADCSKDFLHDLAMHIAAFKPKYISPDNVPVEAVNKEKEIVAAQMEGKPPEILKKIVNGKINKWFSEVCLTKQPWIKDDKSSLSKLKPDLTVNRFARWEIGEEN